MAGFQVQNCVDDDDDDGDDDDDDDLQCRSFI